METNDLYEILEVNKNVSEYDIKKSYKRLVKKYHPDKCNIPNANEHFIKIRTAYEILGNNESRKKYDDHCVSNRENFYDFLMEFLKIKYPFVHDYIKTWLSEIYETDEYKIDINSYRIDKVFTKMVDKLPYLSKDVCDPMGLRNDLNVMVYLDCNLVDRYLDKYLYVKIDRMTRDPIFKIIPLRCDKIVFENDGEINLKNNISGHIVVNINIINKKGFSFYKSDLFKKVKIKNIHSHYFYFSNIDGNKIKITNDMITNNKYVIIKNMGLPIQEPIQDENNNKHIPRGDLMIELSTTD